jgi:DNA-binding response OmpR family regulator
MATILVVDDSASLRALLEQTLADAGHTVFTAADGKRATTLLASQPVDLVVTDIYMPDADGLELLVALRRMKPRPPAIAMSSKTGELNMLRSAKILGAQITLQKPFPPAELLRCVTALLNP